MTLTTDRPGSRLKDAIAGLGRQEPISAPYGVREATLTEIGRITTRYSDTVWYTASGRKGYEYSWDPTARMLTEADIALDALYVEREGPQGERLYQYFREWKAGAYAANRARLEAPPKKAQVAPPAPVDALAYAILTQPERIGSGIRARPDIRGAQAIIDRLALKAETTLRLSADKQTILVLSGGRLYPNLVALVMAATPLLLPYLATGKPPVCGVCGEAEAVTVAEVDVPWCGCAVQS